MFKVFDNNKSYCAGNYKCTSCDHETTVFFESGYSLFNCYVEDKICSVCSLEKEYLCDGDLFLRYDDPNPDYPPWQLQSGFMKDEERYCTDCRGEVPIKDDWRIMKIWCSKCDSYMEAEA